VLGDADHFFVIYNDIHNDPNEISEEKRNLKHKKNMLMIA
jgi:hypothetical protein